MRHEYSHAPRQSWQAVTGLVGWTIVYVQTLFFMRRPLLVLADAPWPVMDPPRHWQIAADPRGCIMNPVMT